MCCDRASTTEYHMDQKRPAFAPVWEDKKAKQEQNY